MKPKGQAGIEVVAIVAAIFIIIAIIFGYYLSVNDTTIAMIIMKNNTLERLAELDEPYIIMKIDYVEQTGNRIDLTVLTRPDDLSNADVGTAWLGVVEDKISANTKYETVNIQFNP